MKPVLYYQFGKPPISYSVLKEYPDGKVDIGPEGGPAVVTSVPVLKEPKNGCVTLAINGAAKEEAKKPEEKKSDAPAK